MTELVEQFQKLDAIALGVSVLKNSLVECINSECRTLIYWSIAGSLTFFDGLSKTRMSEPASLANA